MMPPITTRRNHTWFQLAVSQAGNLLGAGYAIAGKKFNEEGKHLLGNKFAQFVKGTAEIRYDYKIGHNQHLVGRMMAGAVYSYGTPELLPIASSFISGEPTVCVPLRSVRSVRAVTFPKSLLTATSTRPVT